MQPAIISFLSRAVYFTQKKSSILMICKLMANNIMRLYHKFRQGRQRIGMPSKGDHHIQQWLGAQDFIISSSNLNSYHWSFLDKNECLSAQIDWALGGKQALAPGLSICWPVAGRCLSAVSSALPSKLAHIRDFFLGGGGKGGCK